MELQKNDELDGNVLKPISDNESGMAACSATCSDDKFQADLKCEDVMIYDINEFPELQKQDNATSQCVQKRNLQKNKKGKTKAK